MKRILLTAAWIVLGFAPLVSRAALLVYEPFNYAPTNDAVAGRLEGKSGGLGWGGAWSDSPNTVGTADYAFVYDSQGNPTNMYGGTYGAGLPNWDGVVSNLPTLGGYVGLSDWCSGAANQGRINSHRTLTQSAGTMAGADGVLWMSMVVRYTITSPNVRPALALTDGGYFNDRGQALNAGNGIGIGCGLPQWPATQLNAVIWNLGNGSTDATLRTNVSNISSGTLDSIIIVKFTFGATDTVSTWAFKENETLSETTFDTNARSVSASIDENTLNTLAFAFSYNGNSIDEIRIGDTFNDVITLPPVGPVDTALSTVSASPTNVFADGASTSTITVTLRDNIGQAVAGKSVTLGSSPGNATISPAGAQTTDVNGVVTFTAKSTVAGTEVFTATNTTDSLILSQTATVEFTALVGDANTSTVVGSPTNVLANGTSSSTITVTVRNSGGLPIAGKNVTLSSSPGNATLSPVGAQVTDTNGVATFTATSTYIGTEVFTATNTTDAVVITQTASVQFSPTVADATISTVAATPLGVYADGSATSTITVTLKNSTGLPLPGKSVSLSSSPANATISPPGAQTTDANGKAIFTASATAAGTKVFSATNTTDSVLITQTASVNFVDPNAPIAVNFNFYNASGPLLGPEDPASLVGPNGGLGEVWNQTNAYSATNLLSTLGLTTSVGFTCDASGIWAWDNPTLTMLHSGAAQFGIPGTTTITIRGLTPGGYYNVWLASANCLDSQLSAGTWSTTNRTSSPTSQDVSNVGAINGSTWEYGNNYVFFEYVVADGSGRITFSGASDATHRLPVNGFQLVQTAPPALTMAPNPGNPGHYNFTWNSKTDKIYDLVSTIDLSVPRSLWPVWNNQTNLAATPPTNTLTNIPGGGNTQRYFALIEKKSPVLFKADFEQSNGGFFTVGIPNDWAWGAPKSDNGSGLVVTNGNGGSTNCWGTVLGDGSTPSGLITPGASSVLQSPPISFKGVTTAQLTFAAAVDAVSSDLIYIQVLEAGTDAWLNTLNPITVPRSAGWTSFGPVDISVAAGKNAYLQFVFYGSDGSRIGLYIDDVLVTGQ